MLSKCTGVMGDHIPMLSKFTRVMSVHIPMFSKCTGVMGVHIYVQQVYWGNGLFAYWELKQLPNFALAVPVLAIVLVSAYNFMW